MLEYAGTSERRCTKLLYITKDNMEASTVKGTHLSKVCI